MKESMLYEKLSGDRTRCNVCAVRCVIPPGKRGVCMTRLNQDGTLYTLIYGAVSSACADPIEKKPLFHFHPGTRCFSLGTLGCSFHCPGCQNWSISHDRPGDSSRFVENLEPQESISLTRKANCAGICWTYNEPLIWIEQTAPAVKIAKEKGLYSCFVTNGYGTPEQMEIVGPYLGAWRVDIKGFSRTTYKKISKIAKFEPVLEMTKMAKQKYGIHVECVTNVTPTINDDEKELRELARWIRTEIGEFTPWHVTRFHPHRDLESLPPTPVKTLERTYEIGREEGLRYVYTGNVPGHRWEDTFCHHCGEAVIRRQHFVVLELSIRKGRCAKCGRKLPGVWGTVEPAASSG